MSPLLQAPMLQDAHSPDALLRVFEASAFFPGHVCFIGTSPCYLWPVVLLYPEVTEVVSYHTLPLGVIFRWQSLQEDGSLHLDSWIVAFVGSEEQ